MLSLRRALRTVWGLVGSGIHYNDTFHVVSNGHATMIRHHRQDIFFCTVVAVLATITIIVLTATWPHTPDGWFHLQRVRALAEALRWGVLYPRWFPDFAFGYGYPVLNFYAPAFYYPPALLHRMGVDVITATRITAALAYALSGIAAYIAARRFASPRASGLAAVVYLVYPYHLYDLFVRGALPEFVAFLWPPLLLWSGHRLHRTGRTLDVLITAFVWTGLVLTHNLTAFMVGLVYGAIILYTATSSLKRAARHLIALGIGTLLSAFYVIPALVEIRWVGLGIGPDVHGYARHLVALKDLFTWQGTYPYPTADVPVVPTPAYTALLLVVAFVAGWKHRRRVLWVGIGGLALVLLLMTTRVSEPVWAVFSPLLGKLQFPWRWHTLLALCWALLAALPIDALGERRPRWQTVIALSLALYVSVYGLRHIPIVPADYTASDVTVERMWAFDAEHGQVGASWTGEFLPRWVTEQRWAIGREPTVLHVYPAAAFSDLRLERKGYVSLAGTYTASLPGVLTFHTFYYPAWHVRVDGREVPVIPLTNLGLLAARVPAGEHTFDVRWGATWAVQWGRSLTALGWLLVFGLIVLIRRRVPSRAAIAWTLVGALALGGSINAFERHVTPKAPAVHYSDVSAAGAWVDIRKDQAVVHLYWLVHRYAPDATVFVHLVDENGRPVAQHDGPLGGPYTPPKRQFPGLLVPDDHPVPLKGVPPGTYRWVIGLYRPLDPAHPLIPAGQHTPFVEIGTLTVGDR